VNRAVPDTQVMPSPVLSIEQTFNLISEQIRKLEEVTSFETLTSWSRSEREEVRTKYSDIIQFCLESTNTMNKIKKVCEGAFASEESLVDFRSDTSIMGLNDNNSKSPVISNTPSRSEEHSLLQERFTLDLDLAGIIGNESPSVSSGNLKPENEVHSLQTSDGAAKSMKEPSKRSVDSMESVTVEIPPQTVIASSSESPDDVTIRASPNEPSRFLSDSESCLEGVVHYVPSPSLSPHNLRIAASVMGTSHLPTSLVIMTPV